MGGPDPMSFSFDDDGSGGSWETCTGLSKKHQKQKDAKKKQDDEAKALGYKDAKQAVSALSGKMIPGLNPIDPTKAKAGETAVPQGMMAGSALVAKIQADAAAKAAAGQPTAETEVTVNKNVSTATIPCPPEKIGRIIGPQGKTLKMLTEKTGVDRIDTSGEVVTIIGDPEAVQKCETAVKEMIEKGFMAIAFDNFNEQSIMVHPICFPDIIGSKGAIIMKIKQELKVEIGIPATPPKDSKGWAKKKYPITVAGSAEGVEKAKEVISDIVYYKHHPITHEGFVHEELEIEEWLWKFIIGPKGSEMRHIQNSFRVMVNIPRENWKDTGANPNVLIVGQEIDVERAKKHIQKVLWNAENNPGGGRGREDAAMGDERDNDDAVDPIAAQYLYKRK